MHHHDAGSFSVLGRLVDGWMEAAGCFDRIEQWFEERFAASPNVGVVLGSRMLRMLLYADDLVLLAQSKLDLQLMMRALADFCDEYDMTVNVDKSVVVVFGSSPLQTMDPPIQLRGRNGVRQPIPQVSEFKYLGVVMHETRGVSACVADLSAAGRRAMWAMLSRCGSFGIGSLSMKVRLFGSLVSPILSYCSEVWAPSVMVGARSATQLLNVAEQSSIQLMFLRLIAGSPRRSTRRELLLREFGCQPLAHHWIVSAVALWNRCVRRSGKPGTDWLVEAMQSDILSAGGSQTGDSWSHQLHAILARVNSGSGLLDEALSCMQAAFREVTVTGSMGQHCQEMSESVVSQAFDAYMNACWSHLPANPRDATSGQVICCTYEQWFASCPFSETDRSRPESWCCAFHREAGVPRLHLHSLLRFRLGAHCLGIATGRWHGLPRDARVCQWCGQVDDEFHMVFECPALMEVRSKYADLFTDFGGHGDLGGVCSGGRQMAHFMQQDSCKVAAFVHECLDVLALCDADDFPPTPGGLMIPLLCLSLMIHGVLTAVLSLSLLTLMVDALLV
jgi:hypothetical protein